MEIVMTLDYRTLLLDVSYRPIRVISWMRAIALDLNDRVRVVETYDAIVRSPSTEMPVPAVVALKQFHGFRPFRVHFGKRNVFLRDGHICQYCGDKFPSHRLTLDHVYPKSKGGPTSWENVVTACDECNARKGDRTPQEARMPLLSVPQAPTALIGTLSHTVPPEWEGYLLREAALA